MAEAAAYTAAEAAFVLREPVRTIKRALDDGPVQAKLVAKAGGTVRAIAWSDLLYLHAVRALRDELTPKARHELYHAISGLQIDRAHEVRFGRLSVAIGDLRAELEERSRELVELVGKIEFGANGEPLLKGSSVEVHRIAALLEGGLTPGEVLEDYPSLQPADVDTARVYADAHPKAGRPYPRMTAKRALRGAGLEVLDDVIDAERA